MKKCSRCKVVFHLDERTRCLYCNSLLMTTTRDDTRSFDDDTGLSEFTSEQPVIKQVLDQHNLKDHGRVTFILGSYFRSRTFHFMYMFSRHQFLRGKTYPRILVQPLNATSFLMVPWVAFNLLDTLLIRLSYNAHCSKCETKFRKVTGLQVHDPEECMYHREYNTLIDDILSGAILTTEEQHTRQSQMKIAVGKRSAYQDLCSPKDFFSGLLDVTCIWFSVCIIIFGLVAIFFPTIFVWVHGLDLS